MAVCLQGPSALVLAACGAAGTGTPEPMPMRRAPPEEIVVRTDHFVFHMGARVDETWPTRAEETRAALGQEAAILLDDEETTVPILVKQLGVVWPGLPGSGGPSEPMDFDVALAPDGVAVVRCDTKLPRRLELTAGARPEPTLFFACVLERALLRLERESVLGRAAGAPALYACIVRYAVGSVLVSGVTDARVSRRLEQGLGEVCTTRELDWLGTEWVKRVRDEEGAAAFGARAAREFQEARRAAAFLGVQPERTGTLSEEAGTVGGGSDAAVEEARRHASGGDTARDD